MSNVADEASSRRLKDAQKFLAEKVSELEALTSGAMQVKCESELATAQTTYDLGKAKQTEFRKQFESQVAPLNDAHPFRRAFLDDPTAAEFVRNDPEWLRVVLLLYGGLTGTHLTTYIRQYAEIARVLQMDDATRTGFIAKLRKKPYWRQEWDGDDVVYNLAVYLDNECGTLRRAAAHATLEFDPNYLCMDSVLTTFLLANLQCRVSGKSLLNPLLAIAREPIDPLRSASAVLALLALNPASVFNELLRFSRDDAYRETSQTLRELLQQRLGLMRDASVLYEVSKKAKAELDHLGTSLQRERYEGVLSVFYRALCSALLSPPDPQHLISKMEIPYANAELWGTWLSGEYGEDPSYDFSVVLDTIGAKVHSMDALANLHRTHVTRCQQSTKWILDIIPPVWESPSDTFAEALTIAQESYSPILKELFHVGTMQYLGVNFKEARDLLIETLAASLSLSDQNCSGLLHSFNKEMMLGELSTETSYFTEDILIERARAFSDPVIRARTLWRVARSLIPSGEITLFSEAISAAEKLTDPLQRARAFERLHKDAPRSMRPALYQQIREAIALITDINNRVRALCRLAILSSGSENGSLWTEAVELLASIADDSARIETLVLMRNLAIEHQMPQDGLDAIAESQEDSWYRHKGMNLPGFELVVLTVSMKQPAEAVPLILYGILLDSLAFLDRNQGLNAPWLGLSQREQRDAVLGTLLADISRSEAGMLPLTKTAIKSLSALANSESAEIARQLLPHLVLSRQRVSSEMVDWLQKPPHECYRPYADLILAESIKLDSSNLPQVLELLRNGKDLARYRAALVLHSDTVYIGKPDPRHRASALGLEGLLQIATFSQEMAEQGKLGAANSAKWTWMNMTFDSPVILEGLVHCINNDPNLRNSAASLVANLLILSSAANEKFVELLLSNRTGPAAIPLLKGFCSLCNKNLEFRVPRHHEENVKSYWASLAGEVAHSLRGLPKRIENVKDVLIKGTVDTDNPTPAALDAALEDRHRIPPKSSPGEIGECSVYQLTTDPSLAMKAASTIANAAPCLRALFAWLRSCLAQSQVNSSVYIPKIDTLLEIAGYCGQHAPAAVFNLVEELELEDLLVNAAIRQPRFNGRAGAVSLLSYIRNPGPGFLEALKSAMLDTAEVQQAAITMLSRLRYVNTTIYADLIDLLKNQDTTLVYAASRLLAVIARHEKTSNSDHKNISRALSAALRSPTAQHTICAFESAASNMWISNLGTLAQRHYQSLLEIVNIA